jgi:hypothetical protein
MNFGKQNSDKKAQIINKKAMRDEFIKLNQLLFIH